jgi:predicted RNA binding protein YcfA (HicA-like mRNA interferase family)
MARLRVSSGHEACRILERHGFAEIRRRGICVVMQRRTPAGTTTVPVPDHPELKTGTLLSIAKDQGHESIAARERIRREQELLEPDVLSRAPGDSARKRP